MTRGERERDIENRAVRQLREQGAKVAKLNLQGQRGWPDRLAVAPNGAHCWLEFKRPGAQLTKLQGALKRDFACRGITVHTVRSVLEAITAYHAEVQRWREHKDCHELVMGPRSSSDPIRKAPRATSSKTRTPGS